MYLAGMNDEPGREFGTEDEAKAYITRRLMNKVIQKRTDGTTTWEQRKADEPKWERVVFLIWEFHSLAGTWFTPDRDRLWVRDASAYFAPPDPELAKALAGWTQVTPGH